MKNHYTFTIIKSKNPKNWRLFQLPVSYGSIRFQQSKAMVAKTCILTLTGSIYKIYTAVDDNVEQQSIIIFWLKNCKKWYGQFLYSGARVEALIADILPTERGEQNQYMQLTVYEDMFDCPTDDMHYSTEDAELWSLARMEKRIITRDLSLYNNHNFITPKNFKLSL